MIEELTGRGCQVSNTLWCSDRGIERIRKKKVERYLSGVCGRFELKINLNW